MILIKVDRHGEVQEIMSSEDYWSIIDKLECITEELEASGIFLVNTKSYDRSRVYDFASMENGWECVFILTDGWVNTVSLKNQ